MARSPSVPAALVIGSTLGFLRVNVGATADVLSYAATRSALGLGTADSPVFAGVSVVNGVTTVFSVSSAGLVTANGITVPVGYTATFNGNTSVGDGGIGFTSPGATATRTALGLGTLATQSGTFSGTSSGMNTGDDPLTTAKLAALNCSTLPTSDPGGGKLWLNGGVLQVGA